MWDGIEDRLALLELLSSGTLRRRVGQGAAYDWLAELSWTRRSTRANEILLIPGQRAALVELLDRVWPEWREEHLALLVAGEPPTPAGWTRLADQRRMATLSGLPARVNRHTAAAMTGPGSKSALTPARLGSLRDQEITEDGAARIRPPQGLFATRGDRSVALDDIVHILDEVSISDRALRDGLRLVGEVHAVLLVENLGAWRDMPRPGRWMLVHVPGWNTTTVLQLLRSLGDVPVVHFGDLDPNGVRIYRHLRERLPRLGWLVPPSWAELIPTYALDLSWPLDLDLADTPPLVRALAQSGKWLEQERLAVDSCLPDAMEAALAALPHIPP